AQRPEGLGNWERFTFHTLDPASPLNQRVRFAHPDEGHHFCRIALPSSPNLLRRTVVLKEDAGPDIVLSCLTSPPCSAPPEDFGFRARGTCAQRQEASRVVHFLPSMMTT